MDFREDYNRKVKLIEETIKKYLVPQYPEKIYDAMNYSVMAGGKRIRPVLLLSVCEFFGENIEKALPFACALEMIHTYSLIHDDLPAMDNDDYRRGELTNHKVYGEAIAILAGDGLLNMAYEIMSEKCVKDLEPRNIQAMNIIAKSAGVSGMVGGQAADIESENKNADRRALLYIHENKTGKLIQASMAAGAVIGGASGGYIDKLSDIGGKLGFAFQIKDDILDVSGSFEQLGKNIRADEQNNKTTYVSIHGLEQAERDYLKLSNEIINLIESLGGGNQFLLYIAKALINREK